MRVSRAWSSRPWLAFPLVYVVYSLIRGHSTHWYPYPFLDSGPRGSTGVIQSSIGIALTAAVLVAVLTLLTGPGALAERVRMRADAQRLIRARRGSILTH